ncbi:MAG: exodeoxyribonuclease III [Bacteroidetes bacterium]|nr:exodeoxyribonuclease III [Bacteroidota bacterium]
MKIISWNVNGIRASVGKGLLDIINDFDADIFCIQETKAQDAQVDEALSELKGYTIYRNSAVQKGYSGTAILTKVEPLSVLPDISVEEHDTEGRVLTLEYPGFYLTNVYVPNSGSELKRLDYRQTWDLAFSDYLNELRKKKPVVVTGDFNVAHEAIDLARPKENYNKTSGYTQVEIDGMDLILSKGFVDSFRKLNPDEVKYTFWSTRFNARARNTGWRIDYFLVSEDLFPKVLDSTIHNDVMGSDHCPIGLELDI